MKLRSTPSISINAKWYTQTWLTIIMLIFFAPFGWFLMWKYRIWSIVTKAILTVISLILFASMVSSNKSSAPASSSPSATTRPIAIAPAHFSQQNMQKRMSAATKPFVVKRSKMVDIGAILGKPYRQVNRTIGGRPFYTEDHAPGDLYGFPNGATERDYGSDGRTPLTPGVDSFAVDFDKDGKAKEVQSISLGPTANYTLSEWKTLLTGLGLPNQPPPDSQGSQGLTWNSPAPYHIVIGADNTGKISMLEIMLREVQDTGEK